MLSERNHRGSGNITGIGRGKIISRTGSDSRSSTLNESDDSQSNSAWKDLEIVTDNSPISLLTRNNNISNNNDNRLFSRNDFIIPGAKAVLGSDASKTQPEITINAINGDGFENKLSNSLYVASSQRLQNRINCPIDMQLSGLGNGHLNKKSNAMAQKSGDKNGWGNPHSPISSNNNNTFKDFAGNVSADISQFSSSLSFNAQGPSNNGGSGANNNSDSNPRNGKPVLGNNKDVQNNYAGWAGTGSGSSSSSKSWNIPNGVIGNGASNQQQSSSASKYGESADSSYEGLIGATGGSDTPPNTDNHDAKMRSLASSSGWGAMPPPPRMGLLGGGETSLNNNNGSWGAPPPPSSATSGWNGNNSANNNQWGSGRQNSGNTVDPSNTNQGKIC